MSEETINKEQIICNECNHRTWHRVICSHVLTSSAYDGFGGDDYLGEGKRKWDILQCMGCGSVSIRESSVEEINFPYVIFYPERNIHHHRAKYFVRLPENLTRLYYEVCHTYNQKKLLLCAAGLRALLEGICNDKEIAEGPNNNGKITKSLEGKINGLASIVPASIVKNLHGLRFLGNQALHELEVPSQSDVTLALSVVEDIMNIIYELDYKAQLLTKNLKKD